MIKSTFKLTFSALLSALSVILIWLSSFFPTLSLSIVAIAGIMLISVLLECGYKFAFLSFFVTSSLSLILAPDKVNVFVYIVLLGSYPLVKSFLEKIKNRKLCFFVKLVYCNLLLSVIYLTFKSIVLQFVPISEFVYPVLLLGGSAFFVIYDLALSKLIVFYLLRIRTKFKFM